MRTDLQRLKRDTDSGRQASAVMEAAPSAAVTAAAASQSVAALASSSSAVVAAAKQHKFSFGIGSVAALLLLAAAGYGIYAFFMRAKPVPFQNFTITKATATGNVKTAAISPDGKYLLYVALDGTQQSLWLQNIPTNSTTQVVAPAQADYIGVHFSPDGNYLYFVRSDAGNSSFHFLYRAPVLGGTPQKIVSDIDSDITFSPDGQKIAYLLGNNPTPGQYRLIVRSLDSGEEKTLTQAPLDEYEAVVAWSPDGKTIVMPISQPGDALGALDAVDAETGKRNRFLISKDWFFSRVGWLPDGSGLMAQADPFVGVPQIFHISYPGGKISPVTRDTNDYSSLSVAADGRALAAVDSQPHRTIYVLAEGASSAQAREVPTEGGPSYEMGWTPKGQLLVSILGGGVSLANPESGATTPLLSQIRLERLRALLRRRSHRLYRRSRGKYAGPRLSRGCRWR